MKNKNPHSAKELMTANPQEEEKNEKNRAPKYVTKKPDFYCPLAPTMLWHHGMHYKECPLNASNRDMPQCGNCKLRWQGISQNKKQNKNTRPEKKDEVIPTIGKTYSSGEEEK